MDAQLKADSLSLWKAGWRFQPALVWLMLLVVIRLTPGRSGRHGFRRRQLKRSIDASR